jgi:hypothetical protein
MAGAAALAAGICLWACPLIRAADDSKSTDGASVAVSGHVSRDSVVKGESLRFWITVDNKTNHPLQNLRVAEWGTRGFNKVEWCWKPGTVSPCATSSETEPPGFAALAGPTCVEKGVQANDANDSFLLCNCLRPHESLTVWGQLAASDAQPSHNLFVVLNWVEVPVSPPAQGNTGSREANLASGDAVTALPKTSGELRASLQIVSLGKVEIINGFVYWVRKLTPKADIGIPGAITLLGLIVTWAAHRRDERNQTWNTMMAESHRVATQYYLPACSMLSQATKELRDYIALAPAAPAVVAPPVAALPASGLASPPAAAPAAPTGPPAAVASLRQAFYYLMMFQWVHARTFSEVGAYYLKCRQAEELLGTLYSKHRTYFGLDGLDARRRLERLLGSLDKETSIDNFIEMLDYAQPEVLENWNFFLAWVATGDCSDDISILKAYECILSYESNRAYYHWYGGYYPLELDENAERALLRYFQDRIDAALRAHNAGATPQTDKDLSQARKDKKSVEKYLKRSRYMTKESVWQRLRYGWDQR